jgi:hypothetical protein
VDASRGRCKGVLQHCKEMLRLCRGALRDPLASGTLRLAVSAPFHALVSAAVTRPCRHSNPYATVSCARGDTGYAERRATPPARHERREGKRASGPFAVFGNAPDPNAGAV